MFASITTLTFEKQMFIGILMYILSKEGQDAFSDFMESLIAQVFLGSICIFLLFVNDQLLAYTMQWVIRLIFCLTMIAYLVYWCVCSFTKFIRPLNEELNKRIEDLEIVMIQDNSLKQAIKNVYRKIRLAWEHDRVIFWQVLRLFIAIEVPAIFLIFASSLGAAQIALALGYK